MVYHLEAYFKNFWFNRPSDAWITLVGPIPEMSFLVFSGILDITLIFSPPCSLIGCIGRDESNGETTTSTATNSFWANSELLLSIMIVMTTN